MAEDRVLLLNPPGDRLYIRDYYCSFSSKANYYWPPQDLIVLSGILSGEFAVDVEDAIIHKTGESACLEKILRGNFRAVVFTTGTATMKSDLALMENVKKEKPGITVIASAGIMKFIGRRLLEEQPALDAVLLDFTEPDILRYLRGERSAPLRGLIYRGAGGLVEFAGESSREFAIPVPRHELFDFRKYRLPIARRFPFTVVVTSLGCPYHCAFCTAGAYGYRIRPVDNVIEELKHLHELGVREILFQDPTLTINTGRVVELCRKMIDAGLRFSWSANADLNALNEEKVSWMKKAGCHTLSVGIESGDDAMLAKYSKPINAEKIREGIGLLNKYKVRALGYFIIGLPGETRESALKTIDLARRLRIDIASFAIATPDIGTRLRQEALEKGWIPADLSTFDSTEPPVIQSGGLSKEEIWELRKKAVRAFYLRPSYIARKALQVRSFRDLRELVSNALSLFRN